MIGLLAVSLAESTAAILISVCVLVVLFKKRPKKSKPAIVAKKNTDEFYPSFLHTYTSPIFNPYYCEENEQL